MKRLFLAGIVCVVIVIAWLFYLNYDMDQFTQNITDISQDQLQDSASKQPDDSVVDQMSVRASDSDAPVEETKQDIQPSEKIEKGVSARASDANKVFQTDHQIKTRVETSIPGLTPELEKIFIEYKPLYNTLVEFAKEYGSLDLEVHTTETRLSQVRENISTTQDNQSRLELYKEEKELSKKLEEMNPIYEKSQTELERLIIVERDFFTARGFSSEADFWKNHEATYRDWFDNQ